jgi:UDP-3-O-[3-hydroxymyristoyl] N-acetylglucosamine deacetylase|tara:strand:- start:7 stop:927 length:921 start_codon:yes stop_codon:yes gene_type:complete
MSILNQKTIKSSIFIEGIGLHTGKIIKMKINPADPNTGIIFKRVDLKNNNTVVPSVFNVINATLCTTISNFHGVKISTIEHLMGAFYGLGIDNALIEIDNEEVPILDGSAKVFVEKIKEVGLRESNSPIKIILINKKIELQDGKKSICIEPNKTSLDIDFEIKYENQLIGTQRNTVSVYNSDLSEIYNSRTFCLYEDVERLKEMNLAQGGSLENAIVVKDMEILNSEGLRNKKEFVNHKILDCMGDIYLSGYRIIAKIICSQGGHKLTNDLLRLVFESSDNFSIIEIKEKTLSNHLINKIQLKSIA